MQSRIDSRKFKTITRRELLKLTPVWRWAHLPFRNLQTPLLKGGSWLQRLGFGAGFSAPAIWRRPLRTRN